MERAAPRDAPTSAGTSACARPRPAVLAAFVRAGWLEEEAAEAMLAWHHSGFGAHVGPAIAGEDREGLLRVARHGARAPIAESRLRYHVERAEVELISDAKASPYVGVQRMTALEFLACWVDHVPEHYEVRVRYTGAYATRRRVWWRRRGVELVPAHAHAPAPSEPRDEWPALRARRRRWAELLRRVFRVEVEVCPRCGGAMRIMALVTEPAGVRRILTHLAQRGIEARAGPWAAAGGRRSDRAGSPPPRPLPTPGQPRESRWPGRPRGRGLVRGRTRVPNHHRALAIPCRSSSASEGIPRDASSSSRCPSL